MELALVKGADAVLMPVSDADQDYVRKLKPGQVITAEFRQRRNPYFHRKFFALVKLGFDYFEPAPFVLGNDGREITPEKDFDEFRRWLVIKAGHFAVVGYPDGSVRLRARSLKFSKMDQAEFERVYSATVDVLLKHVLNAGQGWSRAKVDEIIHRIINFV